MKKPKKKPTKSVDWRTILATGLVDLIVGTALLLISKIMD